ncbi:MAG: O-methyltransferase [Candidatus Hodarchaeales archaeon]|jgi:predicted O-methyltransferase YrrM
MFNEIPTLIRRKMEQLELLDSQDRQDNTAMLQRLRQVPPETGKFLALLATFAPQGNFIEIGTSAGYSALWIILGLKEVGSRLKTFEVLPEKVKLAKETFKTAEVENYVELVEDDARNHLNDIPNISFCFLDAEKEYYDDCYKLVVPNMVKGGILIADNVISHQEDLKTMLKKVEADERVDSMIIPVGSGLLFCRKN